jgi:hypothetical protein
MVASKGRNGTGWAKLPFPHLFRKHIKGGYQQPPCVGDAYDRAVEVRIPVNVDNTSAKHTVLR